MLITKLYTVALVNFYILSSSFTGIETQVDLEIYNQRDTLVFVRNKIGVPENLLYDELLSILRGEKQHWESGKKVRIALMKTTTETGELVSRQIYNMNSNQFQKFWLTMIFQGYATSPKFFTSVDDLKK